NVSSNGQKNSRDKNNISASSFYSTNTLNSSSSTLSLYSKTLNKTQLEIHKRFKEMKKEKNKKNSNVINLDNSNATNKDKIKNIKKSGVIVLTINTLTGKQFSIKVLNSCTIGNMKDLIQDKEGILSQTQILIFQDKILDCDSMTLEDYGIEDKASLKLMIKLFDGNAFY
ncbi:ubiquitin-related domain-containing protein, partial [Neocallimastix sp. 'constans']